MHSTLTIPRSGDFIVKTWIIPTTHNDLVDEVIATALNTPVGLDGSAMEPAPYQPPHGRQYGPKDAWALPEWVPGEDDEAIRWAVGSYDARQRKALRILVNLPEGEFVPTGDLLPAAGYDPATRASGVFRAIAGACRAVGRRPFWNGAAAQGNGRRLHIHASRTGVRQMLDAALEEHGA